MDCLHTLYQKFKKLRTKFAFFNNEDKIDSGLNEKGIGHTAKL